MILTLTRSTEISDSAPSLLQAIARGLGQIIIFLFFNPNQAVSQSLRNRITIANRDDICLILMGSKVSDGPIASHNMNGVLQQRER